MKEAYKKNWDREVCKEDPSVLVNTIIKALEKTPLLCDFSSNILNWVLVVDPGFARFYLLPKILKVLHNVAGRPVISS